MKDEIILETVRLGPYVKVSAVDVASGVEACATGPALQPRAVERLAVAKLKRRLGRS